MHADAQEVYAWMQGLVRQDARAGGFDTPHPNATGKLDERAVRRAFRALWLGPRDEGLAAWAVVNAFDTNGDGTLDEGEFTAAGARVRARRCTSVCACIGHIMVCPSSWL